MYENTLVLGDRRALWKLLEGVSEILGVGCGCTWEGEMGLQ